ncbi:MAG: hypothetical protein AAF211_29690 [Myxococcota bacterium]
MVNLLLVGAAALGADVVQGANTAAMGGIGVAAPNDNAGITLNPGLLGLVERYDFHAHVRFGPLGLARDRGPDDEGRRTDLQWAATALDARTSSRFAAGFAYSGDRFQPPLQENQLPGWSLPGEQLANRRRENDFTLAFGVPLLDRRLSLGASVLYSQFNHDRDGRGSTADLHAGIGLRPLDWITLGFAVRNFVPVASSQDRDLSFVAGGRLESARVAVEANLWSSTDPLANAPLSIAVGGEVAPSPTTRVRVGVLREGPLGRTRLTAGFGLATKRGGGLDYALQLPVAGDELRLNTLVHQIAFRFSAPEDLLEE